MDFDLSWNMQCFPLNCEPQAPALRHLLRIGARRAQALPGLHGHLAHVTELSANLGP